MCECVCECVRLRVCVRECVRVSVCERECECESVWVWVWVWVCECECVRVCVSSCLNEIKAKSQQPNKTQLNTT